MKKFFLSLLLCLLLCGCEQQQQQHTSNGCPVCNDGEISPEPEYAAEWLEKNGYVVIRDDEVGNFAWSYFIDDEISMDEFMTDYGIDFLTENGWTVIPSGEDVWDYIQPEYHPVDKNCVYWVKSGYAYHSIKECVALAHSKNIQHGTLEQAKKAGHDHPCSKCVGGE